MTNIILRTSCWDFKSEKMELVIPNIEYRKIINDKAEEAVRFISFGTDVTVHKAAVLRSSGKRIEWWDSRKQRPSQGVSVWRVRLYCPWFTLTPGANSHLRPLRLNQEYHFQLDRNTSSVSLNFFNDINPTKNYERPLEISYTTGKVVKVRFSSSHKKETQEYNTNLIKDKLIFSVSKYDINLWLSVARQLCPAHLRYIVIHRGTASWNSRPQEPITFVSSSWSRGVLWHEADKTQTELELERLNFKLKWFPEHCWHPVPINTYVVVLRDRFRKIKYIIEVDDNRGIDASNIEFFSVQTHRALVSFSVNTQSCTPLTREQIRNYRTSQLVLTSRGNCSQPCGTGYRVLEYKCMRPMTGPLCLADQRGLKTGERVEKLKVWKTCQERECFQLENYLRTINTSSASVVVGEQFSITCINKEYLYDLKEHMPPDGRLEVHWIKDSMPYYRQSNSLVIKAEGPVDAGLYHCYMRYNEGPQYIVTTVGVTIEKNIQHTVLFNEERLHMHAPEMLQNLQQQVIASWFYRRTGDKHFEKIDSSFMAWNETLTFEVTEEQLGEYLGCVKGFREGVTLAAFDTPHIDMACGLYVKLVQGSLKRRIKDLIRDADIDTKTALKYCLLAVVIMRLIECLRKCLYSKRKMREMDFWYKTIVRAVYGEDAARQEKPRSKQHIDKTY